MELRHHLAGWRAKVSNDFAEGAYQSELTALQRDPVYSKFFLASPTYVLIRLMGRMSISIGRRLGEIYEKLPRFIAQARFNLTHDQIAPKMGGQLELDVCLRFADLAPDDQTHVLAVASRHLGADLRGTAGVGIEIRYNFNPNDSSRLRKDVDMANYLIADGLHPVYMIFAENSPRDEAIARLTRAGWQFVVGSPAMAMMSEIVGTNIDDFLDRPAVATEVEREMGALTLEIFQSHAFQQALAGMQVPA